MEVEYEDFLEWSSKRLKDIRKEKKMTQERFSGLEISVRSYQKLEAGENGISLESLFLLSKTHGLHPMEFFNFDVPWSDPKKIVRKNR